MPRPKILSGKDVISILAKYRFAIHTQKGSHIKLRRMNANQEKETLTIPDHKKLDRGTTRAILNQASKYIDLETLKEDFMEE